MKTTKCILIALLLVCGTFQLSAQRTWKTVTEKYNDEEYIIEHTDLTYAVTNKKYDMSGKEIGPDANYDYETIDDQNKRREPLRWIIYNALDEVFHFKSVPINYDDLIHISVVCYFDSRTKDYVGAYFIFDSKIKDYMTLERIQQAEKKLLECKINAGETYLLDDSPYFSIDMSTRVGRRFSQ